MTFVKVTAIPIRCMWYKNPHLKGHPCLNSREGSKLLKESVVNTTLTKLAMNILYVCLGNIHRTLTRAHPSHQL